MRSLTSIRQLLRAVAVVAVGFACAAFGQGCLSPTLGQLNLDAQAIANLPNVAGKQWGITWDPFLPGGGCKSPAAALADLEVACRDFQNVRIYDLHPNDGCTATINAVVTNSGRLGCGLHLGLRVSGNPSADQGQLDRLAEFLDESRYPNANIVVVAIGNEVIREGRSVAALGSMLRSARAVIEAAFSGSGRKLLQSLDCDDDCDCPDDQFCADNGACNVLTDDRVRECDETDGPPPPGNGPPSGGPPSSPGTPSPPGSCSSQCCSDCDCPEGQFCADNGGCNVNTAARQRQCGGSTPPTEPSPSTPPPSTPPPQTSPPGACDSQCCSDCDCPEGQFCADNGGCNVNTAARQRQCGGSTPPTEPSPSTPPPSTPPPQTSPPGACDSQCCSDCDCPEGQFCADNGGCNVNTAARQRQCGGSAPSPGGGAGGGGDGPPPSVGSCTDDAQCCSDCDCPEGQYCAPNNFCNIVTLSQQRNCNPTGGGSGGGGAGQSPPPPEEDDDGDCPSNADCCSDCDCPSDQFCAPNGFCNVATAANPRQCGGDGGGGGGGGGGPSAPTAGPGGGPTNSGSPPVLVAVEELFTACQNWGALSSQLSSAGALVSLNVYTAIRATYNSQSGPNVAMAQAAIDTYELALWARSTFTGGRLFQIAEAGWGYQGGFGGLGGAGNIASSSYHGAFSAGMAKVAGQGAPIQAYWHHFNDQTWKGSGQFAALAIWSGVYEDGSNTFRYCNDISLPSC